VAVVQYTFTQKQYIEDHNNFGTVRVVSRLCEFNPGIFLTSEGKARKNPQSRQPKSASWHDEGT